MRHDGHADGWVGVAEVATLAGVSRQTVFAWINRGRVPVRGGHRNRLVGRAALLAHAERRRAAAAVGIKVETLVRWAEPDAAP